MPRPHRRSGLRAACRPGGCGKRSRRISSGGRCHESGGGGSAAAAQAARREAVRRDGAGFRSRSGNMRIRRSGADGSAIHTAADCSTGKKDAQRDSRCGRALQSLPGNCSSVHTADILLRCDDSVVRVAGGVTRQLRRSRGFVPVPVFLKDDLTGGNQSSVLAVGGDLKNTVCLTKGKHAFLSQHVGDLENAESYSFFHEAIAHLERILEIRPEIIAYDLHPDYFSTRWALQQSGVKLVGVQHHHAHIASCMAENHLEGRVIGFAMDGTGYGTDRNIWGGEVLIAGYEDFERAAHLEYVPLPGGAAAIREPWRMAVSYLAHHFGREFLKMEFMKLDIPFVRELNRPKTDFLLRMMEQGVNSPLTSSCGRLFDAVAALIGIRQQVNYEAQAAIELEMAITSSEDETGYPLEFVPDGNSWIISTRPMFEALLDDLAENLPASAASQRFHNGLVEGFVQLAALLRTKTGLNRVCLSGGTFHNIYPSQQLEASLSKAGFEVFTQKEVPSGDGGLSLGQALVASAKSRPEDASPSAAR